MAGFVPAIIDPHVPAIPTDRHARRQCPTRRAGIPPLHERRLDLMLGRVLMPLRDAEIDAEVLCTDKLFVVAGARSPWARRRKISLRTRA